MSATNATTNYSFPLFIGTDKPAWLVDWNGAMTAIDAAIKNVDTDLGSLQTTVSGLSTTVAAHTSSISTISGQITTITTNVNSNTGAINTINSLIGNGTPTTTDQTIIGAINELHANQGDLADLTTPAASLVDAINAITGGGGGAVAASAVSFDPTGTTLVSVNVQAAIVELLGKIPANAAAVSYDNTSSGLAATNVQDAIDELAQGGSGSVTLIATSTTGSNSAQLDSMASAVFAEISDITDAMRFVLVTEGSGITRCTGYASGQLDFAVIQAVPGDVQGNTVSLKTSSSTFGVYYSGAFHDESATAAADGKFKVYKVG